MTAHDDAREVLAAAEGVWFEITAAHVDLDPDENAYAVVSHNAAPRLARTLLALTGEQAVAAGTVALQDASGGEWDDGIAEDVVRSVLAAALAAAEEAP